MTFADCPASTILSCAQDNCRPPADLPEAVTFGADEDEALLQAVDALSFYVDARQPLPAPSKARRGQRTVRPSALAGAKLGVYQAMTEQSFG